MSNGGPVKNPDIYDPEEGNPVDTTSVNIHDYFIMPKNEELKGCQYAAGATYPFVCHDQNGKVVFDQYCIKDDQKNFDKIVKSQGKQGKYNYIHEGGPLMKSDVIER
ncbi:MAG: hypothetical protein IT292_09245 [Deltaproteobacteria bacterium]|nr:hypothetical protein [Deltaproteobacteria bacterium]